MFVLFVFSIHLLSSCLFLVHSLTSGDAVDKKRTV